METNRLNQFCTTVETGSVTAASDLLGISHSGLSKSLKILENELGISLFIPKGRGLTVTDEGKIIYAKAKRILESIEAISLKDTKVVRPLRIGGLEVFTHLFLPQVLEEEFGDKAAYLFTLEQNGLELALLENRIDVGITYFPVPQEGIEYLKIKKTRLQIFKRGPAEKYDFDESMPFILPLSPNSPGITADRDKDGWPDSKLPRNAVIRTNELSTGLNLVLIHDYAIFIPDFVAHFYNRYLSPEFHLNPVASPNKYKNIKRDVYLVKRSSSPEDQIMKKLAKTIRKYC